MSTVFVLGPSLENVIETGLLAPSGAGPGRLGVGFQDSPNSPGGVVHLKMLAGNAGDAPPINVYAFYVNPPSKAPAIGSRTADWFFKSGAPNASVATAHTPDTFDVTVPGVDPGAYLVQIVLEYAA